MPAVATAEWTYELPPAGSGDVGLEHYTVEAASGERVGKVAVVLRREQEVFLAVTPGATSLTRNLRALPWETVASVDHSTLTVRLNVPESAVEQSLELAPDRSVEAGEADARRLTELPPELRVPAASGDSAGPSDRWTGAASIGAAALGLLSFLALAIAATVADFDAEFALFLIPVALLATAGFLGYRFYREPYARSRDTSAQPPVDSPDPPQ